MSGEWGQLLSSHTSTRPNWQVTSGRGQDGSARRPGSGSVSLPLLPHHEILKHFLCHQSWGLSPTIRSSLRFLETESASFFGEIASFLLWSLQTRCHWSTVRKHISAPSPPDSVRPQDSGRPQWWVDKNLLHLWPQGKGLSFPQPHPSLHTCQRLLA